MPRLPDTRKLRTALKEAAILRRLADKDETRARDPTSHGEPSGVNHRLKPTHAPDDPERN